MTCEHKWLKTSFTMIRVVKGEEYPCRVVAEQCSQCGSYKPLSETELDRFESTTRKAMEGRKR